MTVKAADPYSIILRRKKIPMAILQESEKIAQVNLLQTEKFQDTFGSKMTRKRPKINESVIDYESLLSKANELNKTYNLDPTKDSNVVDVDISGTMDLRKDDMFSKGQSKRIWAELYKVLDCSDVILEVVDARNVPGTRCLHIENHIKKNASHKHLVIVINKCDLVPNWVTRKWVKILSEKFPTLAFHASITNSFGKGALISLLRQFGKLHSVFFLLLLFLFLFFLNC
jgi:nuclear GTP-binding protein